MTIIALFLTPILVVVTILFFQENTREKPFV